MHAVLFYYACLAVAVCPLLYNVGKWLFTKDQKWEAIAEKLVKLSGILQSYGLSKLPAFLIKLSIRDWVGAWKIIHDFISLVEQDPTQVLKEFDTVFANVLAKKLTDPAQVALLKAQIEDAAKKLPPVVLAGEKTAA